MRADRNGLAASVWGFIPQTAAKASDTADLDMGLWFVSRSTQANTPMMSILDLDVALAKPRRTAAVGLPRRHGHDPPQSRRWAARSGTASGGYQLANVPACPSPSATGDRLLPRRHDPAQAALRAGRDGGGLYRSKMRFGYAACEYSLINPLRIFLLRTRAEARSTTAGPVSVAWGGR
jgi:hypothetical protein